MLYIIVLFSANNKACPSLYYCSISLIMPPDINS